MIITVNAAIPNSQTKVAMGIFLKLPKLAGNVRRYGPYLRTDVGDTLHIMTVYDFESSLETEAGKYIRRRYRAFDEIEGLTLKFHKWNAGKEAIQSLGFNRSAEG